MPYPRNHDHGARVFMQVFDYIKGLENENLKQQQQ
jgi:hypothetical protein